MVSNPEILSTFGMNLSDVILTPQSLLEGGFLESVCAGFVEKLGRVVGDFFPSML